MPPLEPAPRHLLRPEPLSASVFASFGDVIEAAEHAPRLAINQGTAERFDDLARIDTGQAGGRTCVSIFRAPPRALPLRLTLVERHLQGSQAFMPLAPQRFLVVVAPPGPAPQAQALRCFVAAPGQGINFAPGVWHHPLLALDGAGDFLVIDRGGAGIALDCEEHPLEHPQVWIEG